jgi:class 3 adenylate cyclase/tetratricopeptide (TPR) repeat protein
MICASCGTENAAGKRFCTECGTALALACTSCGAALSGEEKFCGECGTALAESAVAVEPTPATTKATPAAERRLVSILFADIVGHTSFSEAHDAEDVRELLSRYFESARTVIERYGGTVEKFIGDAVMAVWGTPVAQEDDAERAVRTALDLVAAVSALGADVGAPDLRARAGVLTGEAAVTLGAEGQGMVAGDLVNTASRIQAAAEPGTVLVGEATKRASEAAVVFEDAGSHTLKGKAEPVGLWQAVRVVALRGGAVKSTGIEPPFVGRDRELRLVKELYHATAEDRRSHLVSVVGIGGIGKSRLTWEFEKYIDGLVGGVWWHSGRCLAYGDGVAFWALAEMVRGRAGILEDEDAQSAREKLRRAVDEHIPDPQERRFAEPRLAHLLGLEEGAVGDQENLFAAARMFFERLAQQGPAVLLFEDIHWADSALLDFIEYLVEWSRDVPLFVLTLARPELQDRRPSWGSGKRNFTSIFLEPLATEAMEVLLTGPVPGLSEELRERILGRAEGVPFYAVETVRMLLDRGLLVREGNSYRLTGELETLEVPETLQALIAARLDGLSAEERRSVQQASVLGRTFTLRGLASVSSTAEGDLEKILASLVRKEVVSLSADPLSPERGQYGFLQDLVKKVAYDTLSRKERKSLHLAAAEYLRSLGEDDEIVEVLAAHYLDAYGAAPEDEDALAIREDALQMLVRGAERAASLAANTEAQHAYERAIELTDDPHRQADLFEHAGMMAYAATEADRAAEHFESAIAHFEAAADAHAAARVSARLADVLWDRGRIEQAIEQMDGAFQVLAREDPNADLGALAAQLGRFMFFHGDLELARERIETALDIAEALSLPEVLSQALNTKAIILIAHERPREGLTLLRYALEVALEHDKPSAALRAYYNLADSLARGDRFEEAAHTAREGLEFARRVGNRYWEWSFMAQMYAPFALGEWDEVLAMRAELPDVEWRQARLAFAGLPATWAQITVHRGHLTEAEAFMEMLAELESSADVQERMQYTCGKARILLAAGRAADALAAAEASMRERDTIGISSEAIKEAFAVAGEAALQLEDVAKARDLIAVVEALPPGRSPQLLQAQAARFRAAVAARGGDAQEAERLFKQAAGRFRELSVPFYLAVVRLEHAEWLTAVGGADDAEQLFAEAREIFEQLEATPWLERLHERAAEGATAPAPA